VRLERVYHAVAVPGRRFVVLGQREEAVLLLLNRRRRLRDEECERQSPFGREVEVDESFLPALEGMRVQVQ